MIDSPSPKSQKYSITDSEGAKHFLDTCNDNYVEILEATLKHLNLGKSMLQLYGNDWRKVRSSLTLFKGISGELGYPKVASLCNSVLEKANILECKRTNMKLDEWKKHRLHTIQV